MSEEAQQPGSTGHLPVLHPVPLAPIRPPWLPVCSITVVSQELLVHIVIISPVVFLDLGSSMSLSELFSSPPSSSLCTSSSSSEGSDLERRLLPPSFLCWNPGLPAPLSAGRASHLRPRAGSCGPQTSCLASHASQASQYFLASIGPGSTRSAFLFSPVADWSPESST
jgi:hypothetical protein